MMRVREKCARNGSKLYGREGIVVVTRQDLSQEERVDVAKRSKEGARDEAEQRYKEEEGSCEGEIFPER